MSSARRRSDGPSAVFALAAAPLLGVVAGTVLFFAVLPWSSIVAWLAPTLVIAGATTLGVARLRGLDGGRTAVLVAASLAITVLLVLLAIVALAALAGGFDDFD